MEFAIYTTLKNTTKKANPAKAGDAKPKGLKSDIKSGHDSLAAERYKAVKLKTTKLICLIITGLWISAQTAEASPVSFYNAPIYPKDRSIFFLSDFAGLVDDLDARDEFNRPIQNARVVFSLREVFVTSLYQVLLTRVPLSAEVMDEAIGRHLVGFTKMVTPSSQEGRRGVGVGSSVAIVLQFFEKLKRYLHSFSSAIGVAFLCSFNIFTLGITFLILERQPPVLLKPSFEVLRC